MERKAFQPCVSLEQMWPVCRFGWRRSPIKETRSVPTRRGVQLGDSADTRAVYMYSASLQAAITSNAALT
eukprot:1402453-Amphidinium_carterae.1